MTAEDLRKAILQQAIQGKLVPQDPNDEPASVLLDRIREEKARLVKEKKIKKDKNESIIYRGEDNSHYEKILATGEIKCIDDEIPFEIPNTWEWVRFKNVADIARGGSPRPIKSYLTDSPNGVNWIKIGDTEKGGKYINSVKEKIRSEGVSSSRMVHKGDFLLTNSMSFGRPYITNVDGCIHDGWLVISPFANTFNQDYLFYLLSSAFAYNQFSGKVSGAVVKNLNTDKVLDAIIPLPPLNEQKRIAQRIEEIQPLIDKYRVAQEQAEEMDKSLNGLLKKSILQYAIQGKLVSQIESEEPASILLEKIQQEKLKLVKEGKLKKKDLDNSVIFKGEDNKYYEKLGGKTTEIIEEIPYEIPNNWVFVRLANLCWLDDGYKASGEKLPYMDAKYHRGKSEITYLTQGKIVEPPCKAILVDGENSGEIFNITEKGYLGSTFKVLQISKCISEEWLHILLDTYRDLFKNSKVGAAIPHLNKNLFRNLIVGLPPIEEQERITDRIEKLMKGIEGI